MISLHRSAPAQPTTVSIRDCANSSRTCISTFISRTISCSPALSRWKALRPEGRSQGKIRVHLPEDRIEELEVGAFLTLDRCLEHDVEALEESAFLSRIACQSRQIRLTDESPGP